MRGRGAVSGGRPAPGGGGRLWGVSEALWPERDVELMALLAAAPDPWLHALMCDCAEHALAVCEPLYRAAGYRFLPDPEPIAAKREWLAGACDEEALAGARAAAVWHCYWGNPIALGAAVLGAAWCPGGGLVLAEDEQYAESMTWYERALDAACDVLREAVKGVADVAYRAQWRREDPGPAGEAARRARAAEEAWQRQRAFALAATSRV